MDADYYGYRDDDDGILISNETEIETKARADAIEKWKEAKDTGRLDNVDADEENIYSSGPPAESLEEGEDMEIDERSKYLSHVPVPSQKDVEEMLVQRKKQELLEKYASDTLQQQSQDAKTLLGLPS